MNEKINEGEQLNFEKISPTENQNGNIILATYIITVIMILILSSVVSMLGGVEVQSRSYEPTADNLTKKIIKNTYYLHDDGTYDPLDTKDILNKSYPTDPKLEDYDNSGDNGLSLDKKYRPTDPESYQDFVMTPFFDHNMTIQGNCSVEIWSALRDFNRWKRGALMVHLYEWDGGPWPDNYTEIGVEEIRESSFSPNGTWTKKVITITDINYTVSSGNSLVLRINAGTGSTDDIWIAYDSVNYTSRITLDVVNYVDLTKPEIHSLVVDPDPQVVNGEVVISCAVSDNVEAESAWINIDDPNGDFIGNFSMDYDSSNDRFYFSRSYGIVGEYNFYIWANDTSGNWDKTGTNTFEMRSVVQREPYNIVKISGDGQEGPVGTELPNRLIVEVRDINGNPVESGFKVWFNITSTGLNGDAELSKTSPVLTNDNGRAGVRLTLDSEPGTNTVTAEINGDGKTQVTFSAEGIPAEMSVHLSASSDTVRPEGLIEFTIYYNSTMPEGSQDVWLNYTLDENFSYIRDTSTVIPEITGRNYSWHLNDVPIGYHEFTVTVEVAHDLTKSVNITNNVLMTYTDENGQIEESLESNKVDVKVEVSFENQPPEISGVPDLEVRYSYDFSFDLSPYINDPDNESSELELYLSDYTHAWVNDSNNLGIVLRYPKSMNGSISPLTIRVSDGISSDFQTIYVKVTGNFPPQLIKPLPDITFPEDTVFTDFNITDYFFDKDSDEIYSVYGNNKIEVNIFNNGTVEFEPAKNWNGFELITIRTMDQEGGIVEDTLIATVTSINDAPRIEGINSMKLNHSEEYTFNLRNYITDVDNEFSELSLGVDSDYAELEGFELTLEYPKGVEEDTVNITVTDGDKYTNHEIDVKVEQPSFWESIYWPWPVLPLFFLPPLVYIAFKEKTEVEEVFLIYEDGSLIDYRSNTLDSDVDKDVMSGMLTAIQDFLKDSFDSKDDKDLKKLEFGESNLMIERSENFYLAVVYSGGEDSLPKKMKNVIQNIEEKYGEILSEWDGDYDGLEKAGEELTVLFS